MRTLLSLFCCCALPLATACTAQNLPEVSEEISLETSSEETISFYDGGWENIQINNAIAMNIIERGYGYPTESIDAGVPEMQGALPSGEMDVNMAMWRILMDEWVTEQLDSETIMDLGPTYESGTQAFYVPTYVVEGIPEEGIPPMAPGLKSVEDLIDHKEIFAAGEQSDNSYWINCMQGWACREINLIKMTTYGMDEHFEVVEPKDEAELNQWITSAYEERTPIVTYYWDPSPLLGALDMTKLEEPTYTDSCWDEVESVLSDFSVGIPSETACAYPIVSVHKFASSSLQAEAPEVVSFLESMTIGTSRLRELGGHMLENDLTPQETAIYFLENHEDQWSEWVPADVYEKIKADLG